MRVEGGVAGEDVGVGERDDGPGPGDMREDLDEVATPPSKNSMKSVTMFDTELQFIRVICYAYVVHRFGSALGREFKSWPGAFSELTKLI